MDECTAERFWSRVDKIELTGCWLWDGHVAKNLYGMWSFSENGKTKTVYAHRAAYQLLVGPIPKRLVLDHQCRVRFCVNPGHLKLVTQKVNLARSKSGEAGAAFQRNKTHCPAGHPYSGDNLYMKANGSRHCRACTRERMRKNRALIPPRPRQRKIECVHGHSFAEHGYWNGTQQVCRLCASAKLRRSRAKKRLLKVVA